MAVKGHHPPRHPQPNTPPTLPPPAVELRAGRRPARLARGGRRQPNLRSRISRRQQSTRGTPPRLDRDAREAYHFVCARPPSSRLQAMPAGNPARADLAV